MIVIVSIINVGYPGGAIVGIVLSIAIVKIVVIVSIVIVNLLVLNVVSINLLLTSPPCNSPRLQGGLL